ncbi:nociceptin receptor isoform X2 [Synchiropus splendidus]|uniref:nociceptin receptor isoform X2 n=1 Tax=Synchiropus splendidus TaxID=270530 RepID=UPI00237ECE83|nr:nociceptin receptor isoform X2 [Synchiropus splendidus]
MDFADEFLLAELSQLHLYNDSLYQNNFSGTYNETDALLPTSVKVTIVVVYMIVCVIGLVGNFLVMYVIIRYTKMKTATNIYIFNLALADSLFLATLPFQVVNICVWVLASAFGVPAMVLGNVEEEQEHNSVECIVVLPEPRSHWDPVFGVCVFLFSFLIPVAIISICYSLMVKRLRSVRILSGSKEKDRNLRRITRMVLVVVAVFVVCWTPIQIMVLAQSLGFNLSSLFTLVLMHFCIALGYVNSSLNPVLYAFLDENFKRCFREFCNPSPFRLDTQQSGRMRSIAREVAAAYSYKAGDGGGHGGGTPNPA